MGKLEVMHISFNTGHESYIGAEDRLFLNLRIGVDAKAYSALKAKKGLDAILDFKVEVENKFYQLTEVGILCPTIDDTNRASSNLKTIKFKYHLNAKDMAKLGGEWTGSKWDAKHVWIDSLNDFKKPCKIDNSNVIYVDFQAKKRVS